MTSDNGYLPFGCPKCGAAGVYLDCFLDKHCYENYRVSCHNCGASTYYAYGDEEEAVGAWLSGALRED